jgi:hypothetical protein
MHEQIMTRFDEKVTSMAKYWVDYRDDFDSGARTYIFTDLCADALKATEKFGFSDDDKQTLVYALRERAWRYSRFINAAEAICAIGQIKIGIDLLKIQWNKAPETINQRTEEFA